jgi:hypothetical protein
MIVIMMMIICYGGPFFRLARGLPRFFGSNKKEKYLLFAQKPSDNDVGEKKKYIKKPRWAEPEVGKWGRQSCNFFFSPYWPLFFTHEKPLAF